jgi:hypothetical protein
MSCDISAHCTPIADLASYSTSGAELDDYATTKETDAERNPPAKRCRSGPAADLSKSKAHRHETGLRIVPDTTHADPQYVWGDEGPVND